MKTYQVVLTKSYTVTIHAKSEEQARRFSEFYTDDASDISTDKDRSKNGFSIEEIECGINDVFDVKEVFGS